MLQTPRLLFPFRSSKWVLFARFQTFLFKLMPYLSPAMPQGTFSCFDDSKANPARDLLLPAIRSSIRDQKQASSSLDGYSFPKRERKPVSLNQADDPDLHQ